MTFVLDYGRAIPLDAEELAEGGVAQAYERLLPELRPFLKSVAKIEEERNDDAPSYAVRCGGMRFQIYAPDLDDEEGNSWGRATFALFAFVNKQLKDTTHRFYAINGGNELLGMLLRPEEAELAQRSLPNQRDWPYIPQDSAPWYGHHH